MTRLLQYGVLLLAVLYSERCEGAIINCFLSKSRPPKVVEDIIWAADLVRIPRPLLLTVCWGEGRFRTDARLTHMDGSTLSHGTCQVKLKTAQFMDDIYNHSTKVTPKTLDNTKINAFYAAKYLKYQLKRYNYNILLAVDAYNKHNAVSENTKYVRRFLQNFRGLKTRYPTEMEGL